MARRRRKLRSLVTETAEESHANSLCKKLFIICLLLSGMIVAFYVSQINTAMLWSDFMTTYRNHYHLIVHGKKDYCQSKIDTKILLTKLTTKIINQQEALSSILLHLRNESKFSAISIAGAPGVGKSLFAQEIEVNFPWQENCHTFSRLDLINEDQNEIRLPNFEECGRNLVIIDNLLPQDVDFIQEYNQYLLDNVQNTSFKVVVFYLFNVKTYTFEQSESYSDNIKAVQSLQNVNFVEFRKFDTNDLKDCIRHEVENLNLELENEEDFQEILTLIDAHRSGCKTVYSKVLMRGKTKNL